jgi:endonuclease YncB( thermonuclease family)
MRRAALVALALAGCNAPTAEPRPYRAIDGDTIDVGEGPNIRLVGIDAPEMGHCRKGRECAPGDPHGARRYLQTLLDRPASLRCREVAQRDFYGRRLAACTIGGMDLGQAMLEAGHARPYRRPRP